MSIELTVSVISFVGVIASAIVAYYTSVKVQKNSYRDEYYKTIIEKRLEAYEFVNTQLMVMRLVVFDEEDKRYYHCIFDNNASKILEYQNNLYNACARSIWFSNGMLDAIEKLSSIFYMINDKVTDNADQNIEIGKDFYDKLRIAQLNVSKELVSDMAELHKVRKFIQRKKRVYNKTT